MKYSDSTYRVHPSDSRSSSQEGRSEHELSSDPRCVGSLPHQAPRPNTSLDLLPVDSKSELLPQPTVQWLIFTVRNEVAKVMFLQACVCPRGVWGCLPQCMLGYHPPLEQTPPEQTPPRADTPRSRHLPGETATAADGTHPTGMHSCLNFITSYVVKFNRPIACADS